MKHFHNTIQGWSSFVPWYAQAVKEAPSDVESIFVELGTWKGKSAAYMGVEIAKSKKPIKFYTVDTFLGSDEPVHHADPIIKNGLLEQHARKNLARLSAFNWFNIRKNDSSEEASNFGVGTVDFLFIDAGHTEKLVLADIESWWPKMKPGAVIAGDDYTWSGVRAAVDLSFRNNGILADQITDVGVKTEFGKNGDKCWKVQIRSK